MKMNIIVGAMALVAIALTVLPALSIAGTFAATGTVVDEKNNPVPGATVELISDEISGASWKVLAATTSDASGAFRFENVPHTGYGAVKVKATYVHNGTAYASQLTNMRWYDVTGGTVNFGPDDTRLYHYPESDHGYIWGTLLDSATNGRALNGTVYLVNGTTTLTAESTDSNRYTYQIEAAPGDYEIYAVHASGSNYLVSPRTKVTIAPTYSVYDAAPMVLIADQLVPASSFATPAPTIAPFVPTPGPGPTPALAPTPSPVPATDVKLWPLAAALALGLLVIGAGLALLRR